MPKPIYHLISEEEALEQRLTNRLETSDTSILASAFFTFGAWQALESSLIKGLNNNSRITFLLGRFDYVTEPRAVDQLIKLSKKYKKLRVYFDAEYGFHYKLAIFKNASKRIVIIGSSNLTPKGLSAVGEDNLEIVWNNNLYKQVYGLLEKRIKDAVIAEKEIENYRKKYNQASKFRHQRSIWHNRGNKTWKKSPKRLITNYPDISSLPHCWINESEDDETLKKNIKKSYNDVQITGHSFPYQWVNLNDRKHARVFNVNRPLVLCDEISFNIGIAICTAKFEVLNQDEKLKPIIFYRFRRGWKCHFSSKAKFSSAKRRIGIRHTYRIGRTVTKRLIKFLKKTK